MFSNHAQAVIAAFSILDDTPPFFLIMVVTIILILTSKILFSR